MTPATVPAWLRDMKFAVVRKTSSPIGLEEETVAVFLDPLDAQTFAFVKTQDARLHKDSQARQIFTVFVVEENRP